MPKHGQKSSNHTKKMAIFTNARSPYRNDFAPVTIGQDSKFSNSTDSTARGNPSLCDRTDSDSDASKFGGCSTINNFPYRRHDDPDSDSAVDSPGLPEPTTGAQSKPYTQENDGDASSPGASGTKVFKRPASHRIRRASSILRKRRLRRSRSQRSAQAKLWSPSKKTRKDGSPRAASGSSPLPDSTSAPEAPVAGPPGDANDEGHFPQDNSNLFRRMMTPPVSDINHSPKQHAIEPVQVFLCRTIRSPKPNDHNADPPLAPQPSDPTKEPKRALNPRSHESRSSRRVSPSNSDPDYDYDSEGDDDHAGVDSPEDPRPATPVRDVPGRSVVPETPRPNTRSQAKLPATLTNEPDTDSPTSPSGGNHSAPRPSNKRTREDSCQPSDNTPTLGYRISKRQRKSIGSTALPPPEPSKRTLIGQKAFEEKLRQDHPFDPRYPGSVAREVVEIKSGSSEWQEVTRYDSPFDGAPKTS